MPEIEKSENLEIVQPSALEALQRAEVDMAITTAKRYPRDIAQSLKTCRELALRNPAVAATCNYAVPRAGKKLIGPSVHFARIVAYAWGNGTALSRVVGADKANVHLQGVFHDLQTNLRIGIEMDWPVQAPRDDTPERWKDQINLAKRAGAAVALRTAIFNVIPQVLFSDIAEEAKKVAVGEGKTFLESRNNAITALKAMGISQEMIYRALGIGGLESISTDDLIWLHAVMTSIKDGAMTVAEVFGNSMEPVKAQVPPRRGRPPKEEPVDVKAEKMPEPQPAATRVVEHTASFDNTPEPEPPVAPSKAREESMEPFPEPKETPKRKEPASKQVAPELSPAFGLEPAANRDVPLPQIKETKPASGEELARRLAAAIAEDSAANKIRSKLLEVGISEEEMIKWLGALGTVSDKKTVSLDKVDAKWLKMVLDGWDGVQDRLKEFLLENKNK